MPISSFSLRAAAVATLTAAAATVTTLAQDPGSTGAAEPKLDPVLQARAERPAGRSRVILEYKGDADDRLLTRGRGRALRRLAGGRAIAAELDDASLAALAADPRIERITFDRPVRATLARVDAAVGAAIARQDLGVTGRDVGVVLIDSGVAPWHEDLYGSNDPARTFDRIALFKDYTAESFGSTTPSDGYGHGTHVAGTIAGSGQASGGRRAGIAPGAHLIVLKVLDAEGNGHVSDVIAAIDDAIAMKDAYRISVINLSVAAGVYESYHRDPLARAAKRAVDAGITVVASAGNLGTDEDGVLQYGGITAPGNAPWVLTVGASSHQGTTRRSDDIVADFSSRGPTARDFLAKPDLLAPGVGIESAAAPLSTLSTLYADALLPGTPGSSDRPYLSMSGTSMAAPIVSATVALMLDANPELTPNAVKAILQYTAESLEGESALAQGAGMLNVAGAVRMARFFADTESGLGETSDLIEGETIEWARHIIWGNYRVTGGAPLPGSNAWEPGLVWGAMRARTGGPVVWGARTIEAARGRDNIVWATRGRDNIVWATGGHDNIVWATRGLGNIVWATGARDNIVWATRNRDNIVWATRNRDNIVWATRGLGNIVWATRNLGNIVWATRGRDNIVWATALADNVVWGDVCGGRNCQADDLFSTPAAAVGPARARDNIVWATRNLGNIVWATRWRDNIVWATRNFGNIVWATKGFGNIVWATTAPEEPTRWTTNGD